MAELSRSATLRVAPILFLACAVAAVNLRAQAPDAAGRTFEVASVKPTLSPYEAGYAAGRADALGQPPPAEPNFGFHTFPGGRLSAAVAPRALIARAYEIEDYQIVGGPDWIGEEYFAIEARAGGDATPAELNEMVRALLADRFSLRVHRATRPGQVHSLVVAGSDGRLGSGLTRTSPECLAEIEAKRAGTAAASPAPPRSSSPPDEAEAARARELLASLQDMPPRCGTVRTRGGPSGSRTMSVSGQPLTMLVEQLTQELGATVVDDTGLDGLFDFVVEFQTERPVTAGRGGLDPNSTESPKPPLRIAIERQLGLKLESVDGDVPVLVVDAVQRPTPD